MIDYKQQETRYIIQCKFNNRRLRTLQRKRKQNVESVTSIVEVQPK